MTNQPDLPILTNVQLRIMNTLAGEHALADLDPWEPGGLSNEAMAQRLGISEREVQDATEGLIALGFIAQGPPRREVEESGYRQVQCDFQWPDGRYCNSTVKYYALSTHLAQHGNPDHPASLSGYCSLAHANAEERPTLERAEYMVASAWRTANSGQKCPGGHCNPLFDFILLRKLLAAYPNPISVQDAHHDMMPVPDHICADARKVLDELIRMMFAELEPDSAEAAGRLGMPEEQVREHTTTLIEAGLWLADNDEDGR